jgi:hypothetical protein
LRAILPATFDCGFSARMVNQNLANNLPSHRKEVRAAIPMRILFLTEPQINLVNQRSALECMRGRLALQIEIGHSAKLVIYEGNKRVARFLVAAAPLE